MKAKKSLAYEALDKAIQSGKPWIGFCYGPNYIFTQHGGNIISSSWKNRLTMLSKWDM